ncbi:hypothetical protein PVAP13_1NG006000 [Panicum virgatum]|uniref:Uncharacterized protein n=1 Tax=Panicum virgatum TaxID=38727 RepID=A0A8T0WIM1_PANVG|nr:hypothetical protein PVAP13_1NG006000 [Panicum virgatum]
MFRMDSTSFFSRLSILSPRVPATADDSMSLITGDPGTAPGPPPPPGSTVAVAGPRFSLLAATATVHDGDASATIVVDAALTAHNPNAHATALYGQLRASASYAGVPLGAAAAAGAAGPGRRGAVGPAHVVDLSEAGSWRAGSAEGAHRGAAPVEGGVLGVRQAWAHRGLRRRRGAVVGR